ncbi:MAG: minor capsid protein [bacterium]
MSVPARLYRNVVDLNRYSNSVSRQLINLYNRIMVAAANQLRAIDDAEAPAKASALRQILSQLRLALANWADQAVALTATELQGLAELQTDFVRRELERVLPVALRPTVVPVQVSPNFGQAVVVADPTQLNVATLSDDLFAAVQGAQQTYSLSAAQGTRITLPNGQVVSKAFRGIAETQAERFAQVVRSGLQQGIATPEIARQLVGKLEFGESARTVKQVVAAGGQATAVANNQIVALVRTSINQVANTSSMQVYEANQDVTTTYRYVATLDTRTSSICRALDGREFPYGKGPRPPQHFNCRSVVVPVVRAEILPPSDRATRSSTNGQVPIDLSYGEWLAQQPKSVQEEVLGASKLGYFQLLSEKYGPGDAMAKLVRDDGSELTLDQLKKRYGTP